MAISILPKTLLLLAGLVSANQNLTSDQSESSIYITAKIAQYLKRPWNDQTSYFWSTFIQKMNHLIWVIKMWFIQIWVIDDSHLKWPKMTFNDMNKYFVQIKHTKIILLLSLLNMDSLSLWWPSICPVIPTRCPRFYDLAPRQFLNQTIMIHDFPAKFRCFTIAGSDHWELLLVGNLKFVILSSSSWVRLVSRVVIIDQIV